MSAATLGFIIGFLFGGLFGMIMLSVIITAGRADEREQKLYEEYLRRKRNFICLFEPIHGEFPNCDGNCWRCRYAYYEEPENRLSMNEVREAFGFPPVEQKEEDE